MTLFIAFMSLEEKRFLKKRKKLKLKNLEEKHCLSNKWIQDKRFFLFYIKRNNSISFYNIIFNTNNLFFYFFKRYFIRFKSANFIF